MHRSATTARRKQEETKGERFSYFCRGEFTRLNTSRFIAKRLMRRESTKKGLSRPIVRIAMIGIALGMAVMITAVAIVIGFQTEIREKVIGFGSHIQITNFGSPQGLSYPKLRMDQPFYPGLDSLDRVRSIHVYALKEGVIE